MDWLNDTPRSLRAKYAKAKAALAGNAAVGCTISEFSGRSCSGLAFHPSSGRQSETAIVFFHGGGWLVGAPETHLVPVSHLAEQSGMTVYSCRYRLSPEHRFPVQRDDAVQAVTEILEHGVAGAEAPRQMVLAGDSAGAAVAFWSSQALPRSCSSRVRGRIGFYGAFGLCKSDSIQTFGPFTPGLSVAEIERMYDNLGLPADPKDAALAVGISARPDLPTLLTAAGLDPLRDDSFVLSERLKNMGCPCELRVAPDLPHGFLHAAGQVTAVDREIAAAAQWIRETAGAETEPPAVGEMCKG